MSRRTKVSRLKFSQLIAEHKELTNRRQTLGGSRGLRLMTRIIEVARDKVCPEVTKYAQSKGWPTHAQD